MPSPLPLVQVGFLDEDSSGTALFVLNRLVDTIFVIDIALTFFMPYRAPTASGGMWVYDNHKITMNYLRGWFALDAISAIPFDLILSVQSDVDSSAVRTIRVVRLLKLARIIRASRLLSRWEDHMYISNAYLSLIQFILMTILMSHWLACLWGYVGNAADHLASDHSRYTTNLTRDRLFEINLELEDLSSGSWIRLARAWTNSPWELYGVAVYCALNNVFGGVTEVSPGNYAEFYVQTFMMLFGSAVWAYIIGSICGIISTLNPVQVEYRQQMDEVRSAHRAWADPPMKWLERTRLACEARHLRQSAHVISSFDARSVPFAIFLRPPPPSPSLLLVSSTQVRVPLSTL